MFYSEQRNENYILTSFIICMERGNILVLQSQEAT